MRSTALICAISLPSGRLAPWAIWSAISLLGALALGEVATAVLPRLLLRRAAGRQLGRNERGPVRLVVALAVLRISLAAAPRTVPARHALATTVALVLVAAVTWLLVRLLRTGQALVLSRYRLDAPDNRHARAVHTQVRIVGRVASIAVGIVGAVVALRVLDPAGVVTASLVASAGLVGVVAGVAGRSTLGNLIAGLQIAFAEPIKLDDVVVVENEWGRVEEVTLTYVVVRLWDERRLVLPATHFVEEPFQNWTRESSAIIGSVLLWVDFDVDVDHLRTELDGLLTRSSKWDGRVGTLQVVDAAPSGLQIRALVSAVDAGTAFDLRCEVREGLASYLRDRCPSGLPRLRVLGDAHPTNDAPVHTRDTPEWTTA